VTVTGGKSPRRIGHIKHVLFAPGTCTVAGFEVERPDLAMMVERKPLYLALDAAQFLDGEVEVSSAAKQAWGASAARRLGIDWASTVIWQGMPVVSEAGEELGAVRDGLFDPKTGALQALGLSGGLVADSAVGVRDVPANMVKGFDGQAVRVSDDAAEIALSGGAAKAAGTTAAAASVMAGQVADAAVEGAGELLEGAGRVAGAAAAYGAKAARKAAGTELGKKSIGWLKSLRDEVVDAMGDPEDDE
jgi:uncharacterized protein YrrD